MGKILTEDQLKKVAVKFSIDIRLIKTVLQVEASGRGFDEKTGLIKIQFEPYWFQKTTKVRLANGVENQEKEWAAFKIAEKINHESALLSTSWGFLQIMGFNFKAAGYSNVDEMVVDFMASEYNQLVGGLNFISSNGKMLYALKKKDWETFALLYNGKLYKKFAYDFKLTTAYNNIA